MKKSIFGTLLATAVFGLSLVPTDADAFSLTGTHFKGFHAYDAGGDVINTFGLGTQLPPQFGGQKFNFAAGLEFDICYNPMNPTLDDVQNNPMNPYLWSLSVKHATLPWGQPLDFEISGIASYGQIMSGAGWFQNTVTPHLPKDLCFAFDCSFSSPTKGTGRLALAGNVDPTCLPWWMPQQYICPWESDACITIAANNVPNQEPIPEPITMVLFGAGLAGLGIIRRNKMA